MLQRSARNLEVLLYMVSSRILFSGSLAKVHWCLPRQFAVYTFLLTSLLVSIGVTMLPGRVWYCDSAAVVGYRTHQVH